MEIEHKQTCKMMVPLSGLVLLYLITRLTGLTDLPIASSEAMLIHWAQILGRYPSEWLISSVGDHQPVFTWLNAITLNLFSDPLFAGRFVSVLAGLASMAGLYWIGCDMFNRTVGFLAALIYIVVPYAFFYDRLALPYGLLSAWVIWMFRWSLHIARETRPQKKAFNILGLLMGAALLTHLSAGLVIPVVLMVFYFWDVHRRREFWEQLGICVSIAVAMNLPVILSGHITSLFLYTKGWLLFSEPLIPHLTFWLRHLVTIRDAYTVYLTLPLTLLGAASLVYLFRERHRVERVLWLWISIPVLVFILFAHAFDSHMGFFLVPPMILLAAAACDRLAHFILITLRKLFGAPHHARTPERAAALGGFMLLVLFQGIAWDLAFIKKPSSVSYPNFDRLRYVEGQESGYGIREAVQFLAKEAQAFHEKTGVPLSVLFQLAQGNPAEGIIVYLWNNPKVRLVPAFWWSLSEPVIPSGMRFSLRPSLYQTSPVIRRERTLLNYAHFIFPNTLSYPVDEFLKVNPLFKQVWTFPKEGPGGPIVIFKHHPKKMSPHPSQKD
ncbi:MAG: glycosyltransferase family 39 protein [Nitrospinota bacterium]|nr:glycosyltransferase family 39 protein [Nitrospinota bacterium]